MDRGTKISTRSLSRSQLILKARCGGSHKILEKIMKTYTRICSVYCFAAGHHATPLSQAGVKIALAITHYQTGENVCRNRFDICAIGHLATTVVAHDSAGPTTAARSGLNNLTTGDAKRAMTYPIYVMADGVKYRLDRDSLARAFQRTKSEHRDYKKAAA